MNYYNEFDPNAATWLRMLIEDGLIPAGYVDDRSITEVKKEDLQGFTQCHFFAGIGGWPYALALAGISEDTPLWTGSPPCQPFSVAGAQRGQLDPRHLAPTFMRLVDECRPPILIGEQVAAAIGKHWLDDLFIELERQNYSCASAVLPACGIGAPHKRERLFFGALANASDARSQGRLPRGPDSQREIVDRCAGCSGATGGVANSQSYRRDKRAPHGGGGREGGITAELEQRAGSGRVFGVDWCDADWLYCKDDKYRPVESGTFPLANGISRGLGPVRRKGQPFHPQEARVMRLKGYGNAIVPQIAAEFIKALLK